MKIDIRPTLVEGIGAFLLALAVGSSGHTSVATPLVAALTLMTLVYIFGPISGAQLNPAVTIGLFTIGAVDRPHLIRFVLAQMVGGLLAFIMLNMWSGLPSPEAMMMPGSLGEALGAVILAFGVTTVARGKVAGMATGLTVGGSLFVGILAASSVSPGILNPAVALGVGALTGGLTSLWVYLVMPIIGAILGAQLGKYVQK